MSNRTNLTQEQPFPKNAGSDAPFLAPIEKPSGLMMKIVYFFSRRKFGAKYTPIKVFAARLPPAFGQFYGKMYGLDKKLTLLTENFEMRDKEIEDNNHL